MLRRFGSGESERGAASGPFETAMTGAGYRRSPVMMLLLPS